MTHKVAIIGAGNVGSVLGAALLTYPDKFSVKYGVREPSPHKYRHLLNQQPAASVGSVHDVVAWGDAIILAVPGAFSEAEIKELADSLGPGVRGKVVIDATNALTDYPKMEARCWSQGGVSSGEVLATRLPGAHVFKAFNTIGVEHMHAADGRYITCERLTMLMAGAEEGRPLAEAVVAGVGFVPEYVGPIRYARNLEAIAELWIHLGVPSVGSTRVAWGRNFHFQVIKKKED